MCQRVDTKWIISISEKPLPDSAFSFNDFWLTKLRVSSDIIRANQRPCITQDSMNARLFVYLISRISITSTLLHQRYYISLWLNRVLLTSTFNSCINRYMNQMIYNGKQGVYSLLFCLRVLYRINTYSDTWSQFMRSYPEDPCLSLLISGAW